MSPGLPWLLRGVVGGWLIWAGATKVADLPAFFAALEGYPWLSAEMAKGLAWGVPAAELVVGASLLTGRLVGGAWWGAMTLGLGFVAFVGTAWALGLTIDCGCFGEGDPLTGVTVARSVLFLLLAGWGARLARVI